MPQGFLPFFPSGITHISSIVAFEKRDGKITYFNHMMPIFSHAEDDEPSFRMFMSQLYVNGVVKQSQIVKTFGVSDTAVKRWVKLYRKSGPEGFYENRRTGSKPRVLTFDALEEVQHLLYEGLSYADIEMKLEIKADTIRKAVDSGRLKKNSIHQRLYPMISA